MTTLNHTQTNREQPVMCCVVDVYTAIYEISLTKNNKSRSMLPLYVSIKFQKIQETEEHVR